MEIDALANVTITGGTINGTTIGNTAAAAGTFTNLTATGTVTADGLTVDSGVSTNAVEIISGVPSATTGTSTLILRPYNAGSGTTYSRAEIVGESTGLGDTDLVIKTTTASSGPVQRLRVDDLGDVSFYEDTGTTAKFFWDASAESLGIGTSSPTSKLEVAGAVRSGFLGVVGSSGAFNTASRFGVDHTGSYTRLYSSGANDATKGGFLFRQQGANGVIDVEAMRITPTGDLLVGTTDPSLYNNGAGGETGVGLNPDGYLQATRSGSNPLLLNRLDSDGTIADFRKDGVVVGTISVTASSTAYNTSSDYRLKEDWVAVADASTRVNALNPVNFAWKATGSRVDGFLAHELAEVVPEAVTGEKDAVDADGNPEYQGIDQSKLVPLLTAALQEALAKIESLTARVSALEGN